MISRRRLGFASLTVLCFGLLFAENRLYYPLSLPWMSLLSHGLPILDMRRGYSAADTTQLFQTLGSYGRHSYLMLLWSIDLALPALTGTFLYASIRRTRLRSLAWIAVAAAVLDYCENISITTLLLCYPQVPKALVLLASLLTQAKLACYALSVVLLLAGLAQALHRSLPKGAEIHASCDN